MDTNKHESTKVMMNLNPEPNSNSQPVSPAELHAILNQGSHQIHVVGPDNKLAMKALVIAGVAHALPLKFGYWPAAEAKLTPEGRTKFYAGVNRWMKQTWQHQ